MRPMILADVILADEGKQATDPPKMDKDYTWQKHMDDSHKNKPQDPAKKNKPGLFTQSPSGIAHDLKTQNPTDYGSASKKLNSYINRQGQNLQGGDRKRLYDAKEHLKNNYGEHGESQSKKDKTVGSLLVQAIAEQPIYALPPGHNLDDQTPDLLNVVPDNREKLAPADDMQTLARALVAGIQNSTQDPSTRISSVELDGASTVVNNLDETPSAPPEFTAIDQKIFAPVEGDATFDSLDTKFEDVEDPTQHAYASARSALGQALKQF